MIPALLAQTVHQALSRPTTNSPPAAPSPGPAARASGGDRRPPVGGSIASDLGQLTTDTLSLLGLGGDTKPASDRAAQAYANSGDLAR